MSSSPALASLPRFHFDQQGYKRDPYAIYARMRSDTPVSVMRRGMLGEAVLVTRYEDVVRVLKDDATFSNDARVLPDYRPPPWWVPGIVRVFQDNMIGRDGAEHRRLRNLVAKVFTPARVTDMNAGIERLVDELLAAAVARGGPVDLIRDLALPLPLTVISEMMGVPLADRDDFHRWMSGLLDLESAGKLGLLTAFVKMRGLMKFFRRLIALRRRERGPDLVSALVGAEDGGDRLTEEELVNMVFLLLLAGHETTVNLIGNGTLALLEHPDQLARLRADPALIDPAIEELLRFTNPVQTPSPRYTRAAVTLSGREVPRGVTVVPLLGAANRDGSQFPEPDRLDLGRAPNRHVAFGYGLHYCVGAPLARAEARYAFLALLGRFPRLRLAVPADQLRWRGSNAIRGLEALPLHLS